MSLGVSHNLMGSHLENAQRSEVLLRWLSPRIIEQVDGGDDNGDVPATLDAGKPQPSVDGVEPHTFHIVRVTPLTVLDPSHP